MFIFHFVNYFEKTSLIAISLWNFFLSLQSKKSIPLNSYNVPHIFIDEFVEALQERCDHLLKNLVSGLFILTDTEMDFLGGKIRVF